MNPLRKKLWQKKIKNHIWLCVLYARGGETLTAQTEPLIETRCLPPEAHSAAALMQAQGVYSAALRQEARKTVAAGKICGVSFYYLLRKLCRQCEDEA